MQIQRQQQQQPRVKIIHPLAGADVSDEERQDFDNLDVLTCSQQDLVTLYETVRSPSLRSFIVGILDTRTMLAMISGREFDQ